MGLFLILIGVLVYLGLSFGWLVLCGRAARPGAVGVVGKVAVQASVLVLAYALLRGQGALAMVAAAFPPLGLLDLWRVAGFGALIRALAPMVAAVTGAVLIAALLIRPLRVWSVGIAGLAGLAAVLWQGDVVAHRAMCAAAGPIGITRFVRSSFAFSLSHAPAEFQFDLHAQAEVAGVRYGWSYGAMDWYVIPPGADVGAEIGGTIDTCPG